MNKIRIAVGSLLAIFALGGAVPVSAQVATGTPPFGTFGGGPDVINLANLNSHLSVPVINKAGRGTAFTYNLAYDSSIWTPVASGSTKTWQPTANWGWAGQTQITTGYMTVYQTISGYCGYYNVKGDFVRTGTVYLNSDWAFIDPFGIYHTFSGSTYSVAGSGETCPSPSSLTVAATDGSGYTLEAVGGGGTVVARNGTNLAPPINSGTGSGTVTDRNGNQISVNNSGVFTDTLGTTALTVSGSGTSTSPLTFTYTPPSGSNVSYTMKFSNFTVKTNFGCSGISEYSETNVPLVMEIDLPDISVNASDKYTFSYEETPGNSGDVTGRLASVTLPTGGTVSYAYSGGSNGITCADGSTATLTRTTPDGTWTYAHSESGTAWTTTITDPQSNETSLNFQGIYITERQEYQGAISSSNLLRTKVICWNGNTSNCNTTAITLPITQTTVTLQWPGTNGLQSEVNTLYNSYGLVTETDEYAYGPGAPGSLMGKVLTTYASLGNGIVNQPASVTVQDGSGNVKAQTTYTYDQGSVAVTSGTPQHVSVSGSRGNATTVASQVTSSTSLTKTYTYFDTGNVQTTTDVNGAQTTSTYSNATATCGNAFPTGVNEPLSLSRSMVWNCTGGVQTSVTDENGNTSSAAYTDTYFWRKSSTTDAASNVTNIAYDSANQAESTLLFNSDNSTVDVLSTLDTLGRSHVAQIREAPSSSTFDSVESDFDTLGRSSRGTLPYSGTEGQTNSSAPGTSATYDALNRKIGITNSGGLSVTLSYSQNDVYRTVGPAPTGENAKRKQIEYDALGRLTSVCEITSTTGSGTCGQTNTATGFWTEYTYDLLGDLTGVTQNAQSSSSQSRSYAYDELGRMTQEINPESGTTKYYYDTDSTCGTSTGDLVKKIDAVGNVTCYAYDALHRPTTVFVSSGSYASSTPYKYFIYDGATVNSVVMANPKGRMAEVYTSSSSCPAPCNSKLTDEGFSYTVLGQVSDVYQSTPHSSGYYHVTQTYWANGALNQLSNLVGLPTITYNVDGEGRVYSVSASSGQSPVTSTTYNVASLPTAINLGSSDNDSYTFDPNTNRMTQYKFTVNGESVVGSPTWNAIGTLASLSVTDAFYTGGNQSCTYSHDDLTRIASANCGSAFSQTFSYDAFGNLSKSGTISFQPTYSYLTNQMTQIGSFSPSYDSNGNVLNDSVNTYAWDAAGRPVTVDSVNVTYDALGRMVEQNRSGTYTEIVYGPGGGKLALMNGQSLQKAFVPLPGGGAAVYTSSGLAFYRHADWLGSSRFASTPSRTLYYDGAYAPFGEPYAQTGTTDLSFTGMNQDTVSGLYDFAAREYGIQGRWPSPDPAGMSSVSPTDPQTWNRYAYVRNSPLHGVDPQGLKPNWVCGEDQCLGASGLSGAYDMGDSYNTASSLLNSPYADPNSPVQGQTTTTTVTVPIYDSNGNLIGWETSSSSVTTDGSGQVVQATLALGFSANTDTSGNSGVLNSSATAILGMLSSTDTNIGQLSLFMVGGDALVGGIVGGIVSGTFAAIASEGNAVAAGVNAFTNYLLAANPWAGEAIMGFNAYHQDMPPPQTLPGILGYNIAIVTDSIQEVVGAIQAISSWFQ